MFPGNSMRVFSSKSREAEFMAAVGIRADSSPDKPSLLRTVGFVVVVSPSTCPGQIMDMLPSRAKTTAAAHLQGWVLTPELLAEAFYVRANGGYCAARGVAPPKFASRSTALHGMCCLRHAASTVE
jgi:hypothetical protein